VQFFASAQAAEDAGFRACHRCHPDSASGTTAERRIRRAVSYLDEHLDENVTLERLGAAVGLSPFHLQRTFKEVMGVSPREYQEARRLDAMRSHLSAGDDVGRAVWSAGYGSIRGAYQSVARGAGMTPGQYRSGGRGLHIRYTLRETGFGTIIVAWTERGVCAVMLGDDRDQLVRDVAAEFPAASLESANGDDGPIDAVLAILEGAHPGLALPLDLHGTAFQLRVWNALRQIPPGETRTYAEVAQAIGAPKSVRAVARACATNRAALVVPCHRVIRSDGSLAGYRWGEQRKKRLLELERQTAR